VLLGVIVLLISVGVGFAVFDSTMGSSVVVDGGAEITGPGSESEPLVGGFGVIRNAGPFPVEILSVGAAVPIGVSLSDSGERPGPWLRSRETVVLAPGEQKYLWFSLSPKDDSPIGFTEIDIRYRGPLGFEYSARSDRAAMLASPVALPDAVLSFDDSTESLGAYLDALRSAVVDGDLDALAAVIGDDVSAAQAFATTQAGVTADMGWTADESSGSSRIAFFESTSTDALPEFAVRWADFRWRVVQ
jgi:hypothetical protein